MITLKGVEALLHLLTISEIVDRLMIEASKQHSEGYTVANEIALIKAIIDGMNVGQRETLVATINRKSANCARRFALLPFYLYAIGAEDEIKFE